LWAALPLLSTSIAEAERIKDLAQIQGVRTIINWRATGVVGLDGTGDQTSQARSPCRSITCWRNWGSRFPERHAAAEKRRRSRGARGPAGVRQAGTNHRHHHQPIANAKSLRGGSLLVTSRMVSTDRFTIAQRNLIVSGFGVEGTDGSSSP
jgi:flagellar P-ring protein precursor FlgI